MITAYLGAVVLSAGAADGPAPNIPKYNLKKPGLWDWIDQNSGRLEDAVIKHLKLTLISMGAGFVIAFILALLAYRFRWIALPITAVSSILYTIPALATFAVLVKITGPEDITAEIALTSYTLLILFTNTLAGLTGVSAEVRDAAKGNGLTRTQSLLRVELPLAVPTIIAGIRVATVTIISLVTVAGLIGLGGLGDVIYTQGVKGSTDPALISGGVLCIVLALLADAILVVIQRLLTPWAAARRNR